MDVFVKIRTNVGSPNPKANRKFFAECPFESFKIVQDLDKHSRPWIPYTLITEGSKNRRGIAQQAAIIIFDLLRVNILSLLFGKNIITHLKLHLNFSLYEHLYESHYITNDCILWDIVNFHFASCILRHLLQTRIFTFCCLLATKYMQMHKTMKTNRWLTYSLSLPEGSRVK